MYVLVGYVEQNISAIHSYPGRAAYVHSHKAWYSIVFTVFIVPGDVYVSTAGGEASFTCFTSGSASVQWLLNDSLMHTLNLSNVESTVDMSAGGRTVEILRFINLSMAYNSTRIRCSIDTTLSSDDTLLLLQGRYDYNI